MARNNAVSFNSTYFDKLSREPGVAALVDSFADAAMGAMVESAPVDSGEYKAGFHKQVKNQKRRVVVIRNDDPKTMIIESKTGNMARGLRKAKKT